MARPAKPMRWVDITRVMALMGMMKSYSKAECLKVSKKLKQRIKEGKVEKLSRGLYRRIEF